ncbi:MAG TPA: GAF domain-containing protein [Candidatus Binatia bacterium]
MATSLNVLIVEDRPADAELMVYELERAGFDPAWKRVDTMEDYLAELEKRPDVILADHTLPTFNAPKALEILLGRGLDIPFIVVTGSISEEVAVESIKMGAADYILKGHMTRLGEAVVRSLREKRLREEKQRAEDALRKRYRELQTLQEISQIILTSPDRRAVLDRILEKAISIGSFDIGVIRLFDRRTGVVTPAAAWGYQDPENVGRHNQRADGVTGGILASRAATLKAPHIEEDVQGSKAFNAWKRENVQSAIVIPVRADEDVLGVFQLGSRSQRVFDPEEVHLLQTITDQMGIAIQKSRLNEETEQNLERIRALHEIDLAITSTLELDTILKVLLEKIEIFLPIAAASTVRLLNRETQELESLACRGLDDPEWKAQRRKLLDGRSKDIVETKAPLSVRDIGTDPRTHNQVFFRKYGLISYIGVPLIVKDEVLGILGLYTVREHEFTPGEIEFLNTLAGQAAIAIHNAQLFEQSRNQADDLQKANKVKDEFLSVMSHELRTPLSVVMGYTGMVREKMLGDINPQQEEALQKVLSRAAEQLHMINSIMQTTQIESHAVLSERHLVNLSDFLAHLKSDYELTRDKHHLALDWDYPSEPVPFVTDGGKLRQIILNLVDNAVKFTDQGGVTVRLGVGSSAPASAKAAGKTGSRGGAPIWVELKVADTGIGIPAEKIPRIFEKFYQVDSSETRLYGGVGLGLYIVQKFTQILGGTVDVESEPGKGSTFTVRLPLEN